MKHIVLALLPLLGIFVAPVVHADDKAKAAAKFSDVDFARLQLAQTQMNDADKAYALAQHAETDAQRVWKEAEQRRDAILARYGLRPGDLTSKAATIGDDGTITHAAAPPAKPSKK